MRDRLIEALDTSSYIEHEVQKKKILVYIMGRYSEETVESAMIDAISHRWHVATDEFSGYDDLLQAVTAHLREIA